MNTYICLGTPPFAGKELQEIMTAKRLYRRTIHRAATEGDAVLFYFSSPRSAIVARARLRAERKKKPVSHTIGLDITWHPSPTYTCCHKKCL